MRLARPEIGGSDARSNRHAPAGRIVQIAVLVVVTLAAVTAQRHFLRYRIMDMEPELFAERAIELERTEKWIWGYYRSDHGAVLARAPRFELARDAEPRSPEGLTDFMRRDLKLLPVRVAGEVVLYLAAAALLLLGAPWLARRARPREALAWGVAGALAFGLFVLPHAATGYGVGLYTNLWGPMPGSYTTPPFGDLQPTWLPADTISYRPLLEWALYPGLEVVGMLLTPVRDSAVFVAVFRMPYLADLFLWAVQLSLYFVAAYVPAKLFFTGARIGRGFDTGAREV